MERDPAAAPFRKLKVRCVAAPDGKGLLGASDWLREGVRTGI